MSNTKTKFYERYILQGIDRGWASDHDNFMLDGVLQHEAIQEDRCWGQAWWGMFLAFHDDETLKVKYTIEFLNGIDDMLKKTNGIFLRDPSDASINAYINDNLTTREISKDQGIGLVCGLYLIYHNTSHEIIKGQIKNITRKLYDNLLKHQWFIYNENAGRYYDSAFYFQMHHYGFDVFFSSILGKYRTRNATELLLFLTQFGKTLVKFNLTMRRDLREKKLWYQNLRMFYDYPWYKNNVTLGTTDYGINLIFFECVIAGYESITNARWIINILDDDRTQGLFNSNLAALYIMLCRRWKINGKSMDIYLDINEKRSEVLYPENVLPNEERIGSVWVLEQHDLWNHTCWNDDQWRFYFKPGNPGDMQDLIKASMGKKIQCGNGLFYTARHNLMGYFQ